MNRKPLLKATLICSTVLSILLIPQPNPLNSDILFIRNGIIVSSEIFKPEDDFKTIAYFNTEYNTFTDYAIGFQINYPRNMKPDYSLSSVCTAFTDDKTRIEVYYDNFNGTVSAADNYLHYGNRFMYNKKDHFMLSQEHFRHEASEVHLLKWARRKLSRIPNDRNYYACAEIIKNSHEVYTILIKSSSQIDFEKELISSFQFFEPIGCPRIQKPVTPSRTRMNQETQTFFNTYFSAGSPQRWGIFEPQAPAQMSALLHLEKQLAYRFSVLLDYQSLDENLPLEGLHTAYAHRRYVELTFYTAHDENVDALSAAGYTENASVIYDILDGKYDAYLHRYALELKSFGHPVLFRLNNEMNGDWCWYSAFYTGKDTEIYKALWRYIYQIFEIHGVDNVIWVWNPHDLSKPNFKWNHYIMYYPGDEYVDVIGITGYNTGTYFPGEKWRTFYEIYKPVYQEYSALFHKPFMITEFGSNSVGGDKAVWIDNMTEHIKQFSNIKIAVWWNGVDYDRSKRPARIYKLDETQVTTAAFAKRLKEFH